MREKVNGIGRIWPHLVRLFWTVMSVAASEEGDLAGRRTGR